MNHHLNISICISAYNEATHIEQQVRDVESLINQCPASLDFSVFIVSDGSKDDTFWRLLKAVQASSISNRFHIYNRANNLGLGCRISTLVRLAYWYGADYVLKMDADLQSQIAPLVTYLTHGDWEHCDIVSFPYSDNSDPRIIRDIEVFASALRLMRIPTPVSDIISDQRIYSRRIMPELWRITRKYKVDCYSLGIYILLTAVMMKEEEWVIRERPINATYYPKEKGRPFPLESCLEIRQAVLNCASKFDVPLYRRMIGSMLLYGHMITGVFSGTNTIRNKYAVR